MQIVDKSFLMRLDHQDRNPGTIDPGCSADSMDIIVRVFGWVDLDDIMDTIEIDASWGYVCGDQASVFVLCEFLDDTGSFLVFQFAVDPKYQTFRLRIRFHKVLI